jgi:hypothetical protein
VSPIKPATPGQVTPVPPQGKTGTSAIKTAPPKETSRITVKPNLPTPAAVRPNPTPAVKPPGSGDAPVVRTAAVAVGAAAAVAAVKAESRPKAAGAPPVAAMAYSEPEGSSRHLTVAAGVAALVSWGVAGILGYYAFLAQ